MDHVYVLNEFPKEDQKIRALKSYPQAGGFATNAARTYALLGGEATLHTRIGQSPYAQIICNDLYHENLKIVDYASDNYCVHSSSILVNKTNGSRTVISSAKDNQLNHLEKDFDLKGDLLFIDGFFINSAIDAIQQAQTKNRPVVFDADKWRDDRYLEFLNDVDYVITGNEFMPSQCRSKQDVIQFFQDLGIKNFAITSGYEGIICYSQNKGFTNISVQKVHVVDTLGAGDVLHGAFCHYIVNNNFEDAVMKASQVATQFVTDYGFNNLSS